MSVSPDIERTIRTFSSVEDIVNAMKAYAGVTIKRTEEMVRAVRAYEEQVVRALAAGRGATIRGCSRRSGAAAGGSWWSFGSSQGLCGPLNERVADALRSGLSAGDTLLVVGRRLKAAAAARGLAVTGFQANPSSASAASAPRWKRRSPGSSGATAGEASYTLTFLFTSVSGHARGTGPASASCRRIWSNSPAGGRRGAPPLR